MNHNIIGTEVGGRRPPAYLMILRRRRRPQRVWPWIMASLLGVGLFIVNPAVGFPICLLGVLACGGVYMSRRK